MEGDISASLQDQKPTTPSTLHQQKLFYSLSGLCHKVWSYLQEYAQQLIMLVDRFDGSHPTLQPPFLDKIQQLTNELVGCSPLLLSFCTAFPGLQKQ